MIICFLLNTVCHCRKDAGLTPVMNLQQLFAAGTITTQTMVWKPSMGEEWAAIEKLPGLHSALSDPIGSGLGDRVTPATHAAQCAPRCYFARCLRKHRSVSRRRDQQRDEVVRPFPDPSCVSLPVTVGDLASRQWLVMVNNKQARVPSSSSACRFYPIGSPYKNEPSHRQAGPFAIGDISDQWGEEITSQTYVWTQGMAQWMPIAALPELADALNQTAIGVQPDNVEDLYAAAAGVDAGKSEEKNQAEEGEQEEGAAKKELTEEEKKERSEARKRKKKEMVKTQWFENKVPHY